MMNTTNETPLITRQRVSLGLLAAAIIALLGLLWWVGPPRPITDTVGDSQVSFAVDERVGFWNRDACITATWETEGIRHIYLNGDGTIGAHSETYCVAEGLQALTWRVHFGENVWRTYTLHPVVMLPPPLALGLALLLSAAVVRFAPRPVPLVEVRNIREIAPYLLPLSAPLGFLIVTNWLSINFGWHWDEITLVNQVRRSIEIGTVIPDFYNYPSTSFWLMLVALVRLPGLAFSGDPAQMLQIVEENEYWHFARVLFLLLSSLAIVWTYLLVLVWRRNWITATLAASVFALSWEVAYHLRWIAPDGPLMSFGALAMLFMVTAYLYPNRRWLLWGGVITAGFAVGSKYPGGLIVLPVFVVALLRWWGQSAAAKRKVDPKGGGMVDVLRWRGQAFRFITGRVLLFGIVFVGAYLLSTPGTIFAFSEFWSDVTHEIYHYGELGQGYYTIESGLPHLGQLSAYLGLVMFSRYLPIAALFSVLVVIGAVTLLREDWRLCAIFLVFPMLYVLYFSTQSVMYVRNMLVTVPFWSVLAALGAVTVWRLLRLPPLRWAWAVLIVGLLLVNVGWQITSTRSILERGATYDPAAFLQTANATPDMIYWAAEGLYDQLSETYGDDLPRNITPDSADADLLAVQMRENLLVFDSNYGAYIGRRFEQPWLGVIQHYGPYEVNLDYYPGWAGDDRIVILPMRYVSDENQSAGEDTTTP